MPLSRYNITFSMTPDSSDKIDIQVRAWSEEEAVALAREELMEKILWEARVLEQLPTGDEEDEVAYLNRYLCPDDGEEWEDTADCMCNDRCPVCNKEIEPFESEKLD